MVFCTKHPRPARRLAARKEKGKTSHKIHYRNCREVTKIKPNNDTTSNLSEDELLAQGYTVCKVCH